VRQRRRREALEERARAGGADHVEAAVDHAKRDSVMRSVTPSCEA
jgi:hypothetical protein